MGKGGIKGDERRLDFGCGTHKTIQRIYYIIIHLKSIQFYEPMSTPIN